MWNYQQRILWARTWYRGLEYNKRFYSARRIQKPQALLVYIRLRNSPRSSSSFLSCLAITRWEVDSRRLYYIPSQFKLLYSAVLLWLVYQVHQPRTWYGESAVFISVCGCALRIPESWQYADGYFWIDQVPTIRHHPLSVFCHVAPLVKIKLNAACFSLCARFLLWRLGGRVEGADWQNGSSFSEWIISGLP